MTCIAGGDVNDLLPLGEWAMRGGMQWQAAEQTTTLYAGNEYEEHVALA